MAESTVEVIRAFHGCWPVLSAIFANAGALRAEIEGHWRRKLPLLRDFLHDPAVADEAEWAFRAVGTMFDLVLTVDPEEFTAAVDGLEGAEAVDLAGDAAGLLRAQVMLMAVLEAAERSEQHEAAAELAELAYDEAALGVAALARQGLRIDPFRGETAEERGARLLRYADHARACLTIADVASIEGARLRDLR